MDEIQAASDSRRSTTSVARTSGRSRSRGRFAPATRTSRRQGRPTAFEATPLYVDGTLYLSTPLGRVIALDPVTGQQRWAFDAKSPRDMGYGDFASRGVSTWQRGGERRIFVATIDARLIALDARTGKPVAGFRRQGHRRSASGTAHPAGRIRRLRGHVAARGRRRHDRRRLWHRGRHVEAAPERRSARLRRRHRQARNGPGIRFRRTQRRSARTRGRTTAAAAPAARTPGR